MASEPEGRWFSPVEPNPQHPFTIGFLHVVRSICDANPEDGVDEPQFSLWSGGVTTTEKDLEHPVLFGQVVASTTTGAHMAGVTVAASCIPGEGFKFDPRDPTDANAFLKEWGPWAAHVIWDFATTQLRLVTSGLADSSLDLGSMTPEPYLVLADEAEQDGGPAEPDIAPSSD